jgi:hypothetical protein
LGVISADFNADHRADLFVTNDRVANFLWINRGDGTFQDEALLQGVAYDAQGRGQADMGIAYGDINDDGCFDLLVTHMRGESHGLFLSEGLLGFTESSSPAGITGQSFPYTGFGASLSDLDHDGDLDLAVVSGRVERGPTEVRDVGKDAQPRESVKMTREFWAMYAEPNEIYLNDGTGHFTPVASTTDPFLNNIATSRGLAMGDVDNDGDLDMLVVNACDQAKLYLNDAVKQGNWLIVRVVDPRFGGRDAYGAVITVVSGESRWIRPANPGSSYCSSHDPRVHFGLGSAERVDRVEVLWPDGSVESFEGGAVNQFRVLQYGRGQKP